MTFQHGAESLRQDACCWAIPFDTGMMPLFFTDPVNVCLSCSLQYDYSFRTEQSAAARLPPSPTRCQQLPQSWGPSAPWRHHQCAHTTERGKDPYSLHSTFSPHLPFPNQAVLLEPFLVEADRFFSPNDLPLFVQHNWIGNFVLFVLYLFLEVSIGWCWPSLFHLLPSLIQLPLGLFHSITGNVFVEKFPLITGSYHQPLANQSTASRLKKRWELHIFQSYKLGLEAKA